MIVYETFLIIFYIMSLLALLAKFPDSEFTKNFIKSILGISTLLFVTFLYCKISEIPKYKIKSMKKLLKKLNHKKAKIEKELSKDKKSYYLIFSKDDLKKELCEISEEIIQTTNDLNKEQNEQNK